MIKLANGHTLRRAAQRPLRGAVGRVISALPAWLLLPATLLAQGTGTLRGRIVDTETGEPVREAPLRIRGLQPVPADSLGRFEITGIPGGQAQMSRPMAEPLALDSPRASDQMVS